ncbi:MAG: PKD domain-containing protein, partial [Candidatus Thermoplasmatota archaeon]|nr:PKD domain-containing protein [Candidatus Thermoplasmatota archaeon]
YFSNPDVYHEGIPTGNSDHADNARTILMVKDAIAAYRSETGIVTKAGGPYFGEPGEEIQFTGNVFGGVEPYSWEWDFGDGSVSTLESPVHTYNYVGNYSILLTITDGEGKKSIDRTTVTIFGETNLSCDASLKWGRVRQGWRTSKSFPLANLGDPGSTLDWEILSYPDRGTWTFRPSGGIGLTPEDGYVIVRVTVIVPESHRLFEWFRDEIVIRNRNDPTETCVIPVSMIILRNWNNWFVFK